MVSFQAIFYYLLGGVTFVPLCIIAGLLYFAIFAPLDDSVAAPFSGTKSAALDLSDGNISQEQKVAALDLAARNAKAAEKYQESQQNALGFGSEGVTPANQGAIPGAARRLGPPGGAPPKPHRSAWLTVRRQFEPSSAASNQAAAGVGSGTNAQAGSNGHASASPASGSAKAASKASGGGYMSAMYRGILDYRASRAESKKQLLAGPGTADRSAASLDDGTSASTQASRDVSPSESRSTTPAPTMTAPKDLYFCILKEPILYIYSSEDTSNPATECLAAIDMRGKRVSMYISGMGDVEGEPGETSHKTSSKGKYDSSDSDDEAEEPSAEKAKPNVLRNWSRARRWAIKDGELFQKRNAIRIVSQGKGHESEHSERPVSQWFVFLRSSTLLEDWYHALVHASIQPTSSEEPHRDPIGSVFDRNDMQSLLSSLDSLPDPIPLRWLNAMVGRVFYSIYRTVWIEDYVTRKLMKKISRVRTPGFLSDIRVREVHLGSTPPAFSRPMLKSLTGNGEASMEVAVHYAGAMRLTISTVLTISLGSRFKPYNVPLVLAVVLTSLEGNLLLQIKPPPSNRIWYGFTHLPKMDIDIEPVVSERKVQWSMVKRLIEGRIKELMTESMVVPNMDDIAFYDTRPNSRRGGIWAEAAVRKSAPAEASTTSTQPATKQELPGQTGAISEAPSQKAPAANAETASSTAREHPSAALRNRKSAETGLSASSSTDSAMTATSPAMAGLSALLARNSVQDTQSGASAPDASEGSPATRNPADAGASNAPMSRSPEKRKSWFAGGRLTGPSSAASSRSNLRGPQSSLAWGSASVSLPDQNQKSSHAELGSTSNDDASARSVAVGSMDSQKSEPHSDQTSLEAPAQRAAGHERNRASVSSIASSVGTDHSAATADTDAVQEALEKSMRLDEGQVNVDAGAGPDAPLRRSRSFTPAAMDLATPKGQDSSASQGDAYLPSQLPKVKLQRASEDLLRGEFKAEDSDIDSQPLTPEPGPEQSSVESPTAPSTKSSVSSLPIAPLPLASQQSPQFRENKSGRASPTTPSGFATVDSPSPKISHGFAPPPQRRPNNSSNSSLSSARAVSGPSSASESLGRNISRDSLSSRSSGGEGQTSRNMAASATQAALLAGWSKAKTSMADKESRQAAAKEAKDAIKRGWSNWNAKRTEKQSASAAGSNTSPTLSGVREEWDRLAAAAALPPSDRSPSTPSSRERQRTQSSSSRWGLGSTSTDPVSLGAGFGFELSPQGSPEWQHSGHGHSAQSSPPMLQVPQRTATSSSVASSSGYREYRRSRTSSHASSVHREPGERSAVPINGDRAPPLPAHPKRDSSNTSMPTYNAEAETRQQPAYGKGAGLSTSPSGDGFVILPKAAQPVTALTGHEVPEPVATADAAAAKGSPGAAPSTEGSTAGHAMIRGDSSQGNASAAVPASNTAAALNAGESDHAAVPPTMLPASTTQSIAASEASVGEETTTPSRARRPKSRRTSSTSHSQPPTSPATSSRIRAQPAQMAMMAVPGIQKKSGEPTSFGAPPPSPPPPARLAVSGADEREGASTSIGPKIASGLNSFNLPSFGLGSPASPKVGLQEAKGDVLLAGGAEEEAAEGSSGDKSATSAMGGAPHNAVDSSDKAEHESSTSAPKGEVGLGLDLESS